MEEITGDSDLYHYLLIAAFEFIQPLSFEIATCIVLILGLLVFSAVISGSEVAYFSLSPGDLNKLKSNTGRKAKFVLTLLKHPKSLLATILIANNLFNVAIIILSSYITSNLFHLDSHPLLTFGIQVVAITFLILLFGEVIPKVYATKHALELAEFMAIPITLMKNIFQPVSYLLITSTSFIDKKFKQKTPKISVDELSDALDLTNDPEIKEEEILKGIVRFGNTDVKQIMKARVDVTAIDLKTAYPELLSLIVESGYSRIPVYNESLDNVMGILYIKDLLPSINLDRKNQTNDNKSPNQQDWKKLIRSPFFVPENKKIDDLLKEFQEKKIHLAIVVDEYGGTSGIVTLEDIIEEIVGEISDEYDDDELSYSKLDELNYIFEGKTPLNDLYRILSLESTVFEDKKGDSDTLGGFIVEIEGKIPKKNERIVFQNLQFTVEASDKRRVKRVKVTLSKQINPSQ